VTRVLPQRFRSCWTYAGHGVAPGQMPTRRLVDEFRVRHRTPTTQVFAVVGRPVGHSLSPAMHNAAFAERGLDSVYVPLEAGDFSDFDWAAGALTVAGASVTAPFKPDAFRAAVHHDPQAAAVGVANTLRRNSDGTWSAANTDIAGFLAPLSGASLKG